LPARPTRADQATTLRDLDRTGTELGAVHYRLESVEARLPWLEWRAEVLANIEGGGWWRLRGRLLPALRAAASARRAAKRILLSRP
jgi:hypothetical protein